MNTDNLAIFPERETPFYEAWYVKLNRRRDRSALWLRFSLLSSFKGRRGFVHAVHFPGREDKNMTVAGHSYDLTGPESCFVLGEPPAIVRLGESVLEEGGTRGRVGAPTKLSWDLVFEPDNGLGFSYAPPILKPFLSSRGGSPRVNAAISGTFRVGKREFSCEGEPASQGHYAGKKYARGWLWAHCNFFENGPPPVVFEIIDVKISPVLPSLKSAYVCVGDRSYVMNGITDLFLSRSAVGPRAWRFACRSGDFRFEIDIKAKPDRFVRLAYPDVDGSELVCQNTKVASSVLSVFEKNRTRYRWVSNATTAFEIVSRP